jgi:Uma2 family endonuclease
MNRVRTDPPAKEIHYPTSDGKPMAETDHHRDLMLALIETLKTWFASNDRIYVSGNLLYYYVPGDKRRHVSPDVFVVRGVPNHRRKYYLAWEEGKHPSVVIELTSSSTRREDTRKKFELYRDVLKVKEYFLYDPYGDYLKPQLQGYRLAKGQYVPIALRDGRMPSQGLGLHLEADGNDVRLYDPATNAWLLTPSERAEEAEDRAEIQTEIAAQQREIAAQQREVAAQQREIAAAAAARAAVAERHAAALEQQRQAIEQAKQAVDAENEQLRRELERLRGGKKPS